MKYLNKKPRQRYHRMIEAVAERLYREHGETGSSTILWEHFREEYIKDDPPKTDGEHYLYIQRRSNFWVKDINEYFMKNKYPNWLFVDNKADRVDKGVYLLAGIRAMNEQSRRRMKQIGSLCHRVRNDFEKLAPTLPHNVGRQMERMVDIMNGSLLQIYGAIEADRTLTKRQKRIMKSALIEYLE